LGVEKLARHLLDRGEVTREQVEEARRTQGFFGGQIGSHLLKLGFVDEETLGGALSEVTGAAYAGREQLGMLPQDARGLLPPHAVKRLRVCPFEISDRTVRVAMLNPRDAIAVAEIRAASGYHVEPWVTCEYRLYQAFEKHYRVEGDRRRAVSPAALAPERRSSPAPAEEGPQAQPGSPPPESSAEEMGLDGRPLDAEIDYEEHLFGARASGLEDAPVSGQADPPGLESAGDPFTHLDKALSLAEDRDHIAEAVLDFCRGRGRRVALFAVTREGLRIVAGRGRGLEGKRVRSMTLPVEPSSLLDVALNSREFFFGVVPPLPPNQDLYSALGGKLPAMAMVVPISVKGRTVALLYLDDEDRPITQPDIPAMRRAAAKAGLAFEILLLRAKLRKL
jgi:hypothetical protein